MNMRSTTTSILLIAGSFALAGCLHDDDDGGGGKGGGDVEACGDRLTVSTGTTPRYTFADLAGTVAAVNVSRVDDLNAGNGEGIAWTSIPPGSGNIPTPLEHADAGTVGGDGTGYARVANPGDNPDATALSEGEEYQITLSGTDLAPICYARFTPGSGGGGHTGSALQDGSDYTIVYIAPLTAGIDARNPVTADFSTDGFLDKYVWDLNDSTKENERPERGTLAESESSADDYVGVGRWNDGTSAGSYYAGFPAYPDGTFDQTADQGFHFAIGVATPQAARETAVLSYVYAAATKPTLGGDAPPAPGSVDSGYGGLVLDYANTKMGLDLKLTIGGEEFTISSTGGTAAPAGAYELGNGETLGVTGSATSATNCPSGCTTYLYAFAAGANGEAAGLAINIRKDSANLSIGAAVRFTKE